MKKTERLVLYYDMAIVATSRTFDAPKAISTRKAFELMEEVPIEHRIKEMSKGREKLYVSDWDWTDNTISILINKSDKTIADPVFTIPERQKRRIAKKEEQEGQDFSIHVVVQLPDDDAEPALVILEHCTGLGVFFVRQLFNEIIRTAKSMSPEEFEQVHPDGSIDARGMPTKYNVTFKSEFQGHISEELQYDLEHGKVHSIELITEKEKFSNIDEDGYFKEKCKTLVITLEEQDNKLRNKFKRIANVFKSKRDQYSRARIKFKSPTGIEKSVNFDTNNGLADAYVKKEKLEGFNGDLLASYPAFCEEILSKMKELIQ